MSFLFSFVFKSSVQIEDLKQTNEREIWELGTESCRPAQPDLNSRSYECELSALSVRPLCHAVDFVSTYSHRIRGRNNGIEAPESSERLSKSHNGDNESSIVLLFQRSAVNCRPLQLVKALFKALI